MSLKEESDTSNTETILNKEEDINKNFINLGLGDIIKFIASNNDNINYKIFYI